MKSTLISVALCATGAVASLGSTSTLAIGYELDGVIQPHRLVNVGTASDGILDEVRVENGDRVAAGDVIARLDFGVEEASALLAKARAELETAHEMQAVQLADARRRLEQQEGLFDKGIITAEELQTTRTEEKLAELGLQQADESIRLAELEYRRAAAILEQGTIQSPIDGLVVERFLSPGELLTKSRGSQVVTIAALDPLVIDVNAPLSLIREIEVGGRAEVRVLMPGSEMHQATVQFTDRLVDTASDTFRVRLELPNPDYALPAGLRCKVTFLK